MKIGIMTNDMIGLEFNPKIRAILIAKSVINPTQFSFGNVEVREFKTNSPLGLRQEWYDHPAHFLEQIGNKDKEKHRELD